MEHKYGNLNDYSIEEVWSSQKRKEVNQKAFNSICKECSAAIIK
jgi:radical SAM protein with 4Fe4S-binding SPASM domain